MKSSTKWFFRELSYTLKCRVCVALLDVVAKLSIGQNAATTSSSAACRNRSCKPDEHCLESWKVLRIGDRVRFQAVPHAQNVIFQA